MSEMGCTSNESGFEIKDRSDLFTQSQVEVLRHQIIVYNILLLTDKLSDAQEKENRIIEYNYNQQHYYCNGGSRMFKLPIPIPSASASIYSSGSGPGARNTIKTAKVHLREHIDKNLKRKRQ
jgi:hypothetical protein